MCCFDFLCRPGRYDPNVGYPTDGSGGGLYVRDTILVPNLDPPENTTAEDGAACRAELEPCGYTVIRFTADNPG